MLSNIENYDKLRPNQLDPSDVKQFNLVIKTFAQIEFFFSGKAKTHEMRAKGHSCKKSKLVYCIKELLT